MNEPVVTGRIVKALCAEDDVYAKKRHSGKFQSGEPDVTGCAMGSAFYIEVKMLTGALTLLQAHQLTSWRKSGAFTFVAIYDPKTKFLKIVELDESETWDQFADQKGVRELWETSDASCPQVLSKFDWTSWVRMFVERI